ncbi:hypothetical protein [Marinifilum fragile]|uniref:hypothetical protein n=1 Tax=Marinifilum fragile TaxID=570161 RepID=UPI002AA70AF0|nr:hypothetical protein [Marinifilum fragile]
MDIDDSKKKENCKVTFVLDFSEDDWQEIIDRSSYQEWHWKMYSFMSSSVINGVSVIELKMNDFISDYFTFCDPERSSQLNDYFLTKMNLQNKFILFKKLLKHIDIEELGEINDKDYSLIDEFEKVIRYRNVFAHSVLDQNYKDLKELKERQRIKLQVLSSKYQNRNTRYITVKEHREILKLICDIDLMLLEIVIDNNRSKSDKMFFNQISPDIEVRTLTIKDQKH